MCCVRPLIPDHGLPNREMFLTFWKELLHQAKQRSPALHQRCDPSTTDQIRISTAYPGIFFHYWIWADGAAIELHIDTGDQQQNKHIFDTLSVQREGIEKEVNTRIRWDRLDEARPSRLRILFAGGLNRGMVRSWIPLQESMISTMQNLSNTLQPYLMATFQKPENGVAS